MVCYSILTSSELNAENELKYSVFVFDQQFQTDLYQYFFYQTHIIQKDKNMRNYIEQDPLVYIHPTRRSSKKYTAITVHTQPGELNNNKSSKKITYQLATDVEDRYNKENALHNFRSNINIELPPQKMPPKPKKRSNSFLNKSSATYASKNSNYAPPERSKVRSRWQITHYPTNHPGPSEFVPSIDTNGESKSPINFRGAKYHQTFTPTNSSKINFENYQNLHVQKKISLGYEMESYDNPPNFGCEPAKKQQKPLTYSKSTKNIPLFQKIKAYNQPTFGTKQEDLMHNTYSYGDFKINNQNLTPSSFKPMNETVGGNKYKQLIDSYQFKTMQNPYSVSRVKNSVVPLPAKKKSQVEKEPELDDFLIGQCKGQGRFGKVYMAIHKKTGMLCALKKIKKQSVKYMIDQFIQEVKIQLYLNHPKLVKVYGYFADAEHFYMLVEYMEEGCLYSMMKKIKKFEQQEAAEKLNEICDGIKEMHDHNIVHRDLKPENVVLSHGVCKICDFGWAAICQDRRQTYCGTLDYVCPQIVEGNTYDSSADIWCIGVLAYEMMCGKAPFYDISRQKTIQKIKSCKIDTFPSHLSKKAVKFIQMILKKNPQYRVGIQELLDSDFLKSARK